MFCDRFSERPFGLCCFLSFLSEWGPLSSQATLDLHGTGIRSVPDCSEYLKKSHKALKLIFAPRTGAWISTWGVYPLVLFLLAQKVLKHSCPMARVINALPSTAHSWLRPGANHMSGQIRFSARVLGPSWNWVGHSYFREQSTFGVGLPSTENISSLSLSQRFILIYFSFIKCLFNFFDQLGYLSVFLLHVEKHFVYNLLQIGSIFQFVVCPFICEVMNYRSYEFLFNKNSRGGVKGELLFNGYGISVLQDAKVLEICSQ